MEAIKSEAAHYTYADYGAWDTEKRYEILNGEAYMVSSPSAAHQTISGELFGQLWNYLSGKPCQVFAAPLDVRLFPREDGQDDTVVLPDILVVCDQAKLADRRSCRGAPDLVVEIISPSNTDRYLFLKLHLYLKAGVREYWLVDPETRIIQVHILEKGEGTGRDHYISTSFNKPEALEVSVFPGLKLDGIWGVL
jgi:Uma2 family endonuclease